MPEMNEAKAVELVAYTEVASQVLAFLLHPIEARQEI